jgi:integrase
MFNLGIVWDKCQVNPVSKVKFYKEELGKIRVLNADEEHRLLEASSDHLKPIFVTALNTGMRYSELMHLLWKDVNLEAGYIHIAKSKSGKSRQVPINEGVKIALKELKSGIRLSKSVSSEGRGIKNSLKSQGTYVPEPNELKIPRVHTRVGSSPASGNRLIRAQFI